MYQVVRTIDEVKKEQELREIDSIVLQVGEMSDVVPSYLEEAWQVVRNSTDYENAEMKIEVIPAVAQCRACGYTDNIKSLGMTCPQCSSEDFKIISGREFLIKEIVAL
jgi:hydrogenase nickel incorporation protein HypA/HybF